MIYEYQCKTCNFITEVECSVKDMPDPSKVECVSCGSHTMERILSTSSFILKGKGWSKDGYR